jgi:hypothetical protein
MKRAVLATALLALGIVTAAAQEGPIRMMIQNGNPGDQVRVTLNMTIPMAGPIGMSDQAM